MTKKIDWVQKIIDVQTRESNKINLAALFTMGTAIATLALLLLLGLNDILLNKSSIKVFVFTFFIGFFVIKVFFEIFNLVFRTEKLEKIHDYSKNPLDRKYFLLGKSVENILFIPEFFANLYCCFLNVSVILKTIFIISIFWNFWIIFSNIFMLSVEILATKKFKDDLSREANKKRGKEKQPSKGAVIICFFRFVIMVILVLTAIIYYSNLVTKNIVLIKYSLEAILMLILIEFVLIFFFKSIKISYLKEIENKALSKQINNEQVKNTYIDDVVKGSNIDNLF